MQVMLGADKCYFIDGQKEDRSSWMRFINCARYEEEQNLVAFQFQKNIYYRSIQHIYPGNELLVWYGDEYAMDLGIPTNRREGMGICRWLCFVKRHWFFFYISCA